MGEKSSDNWEETRAAEGNLSALVSAIDSMFDKELSDRAVAILQPLALRAMSATRDKWALMRAVSESRDVELMRETVRALAPLAVEAVQRMPLPNLPPSDPSLNTLATPYPSARG